MKSHINNIHREPHFAVIGTGASALGVLSGLLDQKDNYKLSIFDIGKDPQSGPDASQIKTEHDHIKYYDELYYKIKKLHPLKFPPPKTFFGELISKQMVKNSNGLTIYKSNTFGGLTNYWGATMLPYTQQEMKNWPITIKQLQKHYEKISTLVGISARPDELNKYFIHDYASRPPIKTIQALQNLNDSINRNSTEGDNFHIYSGLNRCAIETRIDQETTCSYCGECLVGCFKKSIFSSKDIIQYYIQNKKNFSHVTARVNKIDLKMRTLLLEKSDGTQHVTEKFDKIFLCAGCPASTEIILRSQNSSARVIMKDNAVYVLPIFYFGSNRQKPSHHKLIALSNLLLACIPKNSSSYFAQVQIYPNFDYLWRYNIPLQLWPLLRPLIHATRSRLFWARIYVHSDISQAYGLYLKDNDLIIELERAAKKTHYIDTLIADIRKIINKEGFFIPPIRPVLEKSNSHYSGTFSFDNISSNGEIAPHVYLCDSSTFPNSNAISPTFTIMANARRIAEEAIT